MDQFSPTKPSDKSSGLFKINNFHAPKNLLLSPKSHTLKPLNDKSTSQAKSPSLIEIVEVSIPFPESARILSPKNNFTPRTVIGRSPRDMFTILSPREGGSPMSIEPLFGTDTLKIFTQKMDAVKEMEDLHKKSEGKTGEKTKTNSQQMVIKRGDSVRTIKAVVENGKKQLNRKPKEKLKGSMFVNELWGNSYENDVMRATSLDKVIKRKEDKNRKPYFERLKEMAQSFENRSKEDEILPPVWTATATPKKYSTNLDSSDASNSFDYYSATLRTEPNQEIATSPGRNGKSKLSIFSRAPLGRFNFASETSEDDSQNIRIRMKSCPDAQDIINSALESRTPLANGELPNDFSSSMAKQETVPVFRGNNMTLSSKLIETSRRASLALSARPDSSSGKLPEMKPRKSKFTLNLEFSASNPSPSPRETPNSGTEIKNNLVKIPGLHNGISTRRVIVKHNVKSQNQERFEALIEKCQTELDDKKNYKGMIQELKGLFVKKRGYLKEQVQKQKKESGVDQCRFFLNKTQQK